MAGRVRRLRCGSGYRKVHALAGYRDADGHREKSDDGDYPLHTPHNTSASGKCFVKNRYFFGFRTSSSAWAIFPAARSRSAVALLFGTWYTLQITS